MAPIQYKQLSAADRIVQVINPLPDEEKQAKCEPVKRQIGEAELKARVDRAWAAVETAGEVWLQCKADHPEEFQE